VSTTDPAFEVNHPICNGCGKRLKKQDVAVVEERVWNGSTLELKGRAAVCRFCGFELLRKGEKVNWR